MASVEELPRLSLSDTEKQRLINHFVFEIDTSESEREAMVDDLIEEIKAYEARPGPQKQHPWPGASNLVVPLIASMVDATFPRLHATIFGASNIITVEEGPEDFADHAKAWQFFNNWSMIEELNLESVSDSWFLESIIHGTSVVKLTWERLERETLAYNDNGEVVEKSLEIVRNQPVLEHVNLEDFLIRLHEHDISAAEWVGQRIKTNIAEVDLRAENGLYDQSEVDKIKNFFVIESEDYEEAREELENRDPLNQKRLTIYELWADYDIRGKGIVSPIVVTIHKESRAILRIQANPYKHRRKPFREIVYFPRHDRFYGIGLARQLMPLQSEISTIHNQRIDNATIANSKMYKVIGGSRADHSFQGAAPGLKIVVDAHDEIDTLEMGDVHASDFEAERVAMQFAQQRSGISDFTNGIDFGKGGGRQTATQAVVQMQEARNRFNWSLNQVREAIADVAGLLHSLYSQFGKDQNERFAAVVGEEDSDLILELLATRQKGVLSMQVTASSASTNRAVEQQNLLAMMQLHDAQVREFEMPLIQMLMDPNVPPFVKDYAVEKIEGGRALMKRILETSDVRNTAEILGSTEKFRESAEPPPPPPPPQSGPPISGSGPPGLGGLPGDPGALLGGAGGGIQPPGIG